MALTGPFLFEDLRFARGAARVVRAMPPVSGAAIRLVWLPGLRDARGPVHAGAFLRERRIAFDCTRAEFRRILAHETAHFVWVRLGNATRRSWEDMLREESGAGELGWSAEWRKAALDGRDRDTRTRRWREYCCEAFCDTAAWLWSGVAQHDEFTLARRWRETRRRWFASKVEDRTLSI